MTDRVTKRSGTATGQKARRAVRRDTVDEDIPRSATEDVQATAAPRHGMESSGVGETGIANVVNNIMQAQKKRYSIAQSSIRKKHKQTVSDAEKEVAKLFDNHEVRASQAHETQLRRLQTLLKQKAEIEAAMDKRVARMQSAYSMYGELLQSVYEQRAHQLDCNQ